MKNVYGKDIKDNTRLTRHYQDYELAEVNKDWKQNTVEDYCPKRDVSYDDCLNKLGQLEDIEEELGIKIIVLYKALKYGFYYKDFLNDIEYIDGHSIRIANAKKLKELKNDLLNYGKTWALTKEEL